MSKLIFATLRIKGEAEAADNAKVAASLTAVLVQQQYLARWDGRLPQYTLGGTRCRSSRSRAGVPAAMPPDASAARPRPRGRRE